MANQSQPKWITNDEREGLLIQHQDNIQAYRRNEYVKDRQAAKRSARYAPRTGIVSMGHFGR